MEGSDPGPGEASADAAPLISADEPMADHSAGEAPVQPSDMEGCLLGDTLAEADISADLSDLHAALATLSDDTFAYLDLALDHLTSTSDLFDVPAIDLGDIPDDLAS